MVAPGGALNAKVVCRQTAELFSALGAPGALPAEICRSETELRQVEALLLDGILEIERDGRFLSGSAALGRASALLLTAESNRPAEDVSLAALQYGARLKTDSSKTLGVKLYCYNRLPVTTTWADRFSSVSRVQAYLGLDEPQTKRLLARWNRVEASPSNPDWFFWRTKAHRPEAHFKLYINPHVRHLAAAGRTIFAVLSMSPAAGFKVGSGVANLLRPDKCVAYFGSFDELQSTAAQLAQRLQGAPVQAVPFAAALTGDGLLSWGIDPPGNVAQYLPLGGVSWRRWLTDRIAAAIKTGRAANLTVEEIIGHVHRRTELFGVDPSSWAPRNVTW